MEVRTPLDVAWYGGSRASRLPPLGAIRQRLPPPQWDAIFRPTATYYSDMREPATSPFNFDFGSDGLPRPELTSGPRSAMVPTRGTEAAVSAACRPDLAEHEILPDGIESIQS